MVREFRAALQGRKSQDRGEATATEWCQWAQAEADRIDPLTNQEPIVQELTPPESWVVPPPKVGNRHDRWRGPGGGGGAGRDAQLPRPTEMRDSLLAR